MEGVALDQFKKFKPYTIPMAQFHYHLSDEIGKGDSTTATCIHIHLQFLITKGIMDPFLTTMWDHMDSFVKQYLFASAIYLLSLLAL